MRIATGEPRKTCQRTDVKPTLLESKPRHLSNTRTSNPDLLGRRLIHGAKKVGLFGRRKSKFRLLPQETFRYTFHYDVRLHCRIPESVPIESLGPNAL
jgi:hypothetical protein